MSCWVSYDLHSETHSDQSCSGLRHQLDNEFHLKCNRREARLWLWETLRCFRFSFLVVKLLLHKLQRKLGYWAWWLVSQLKSALNVYKHMAVHLRLDLRLLIVHEHWTYIWTFAFPWNFCGKVPQDRKELKRHDEAHHAGQSNLIYSLLTKTSRVGVSEASFSIISFEQLLMWKNFRPPYKTIWAFSDWPSRWTYS